VKIKVYVIDFETPRGLRKTIAYAAPLAVILGVATLVLATPQQWNTGQTLQASDLNKLAVLTNGSSKYSVGATASADRMTVAGASAVAGHARRAKPAGEVALQTCAAVRHANSISRRSISVV
jgi:hypothetical protein